MTFRIRHIILTVILLSSAMAIADGESQYGFWTYLAVAALFALVFSVALSRGTNVWRGTIGALVGWATAIAVGQVEYVLGYWTYQGSTPYFEDGVIWGVFLLPIYAWVIFAIPCAVLGALIGWCVGIATQLISRREKS